MDAALGLGARESWKEDRSGVGARDGGVGAHAGVGAEVVLGAGGRVILNSVSADGPSCFSRSEKEEGTMAAPDNGKGSLIDC